MQRVFFEELDVYSTHIKSCTEKLVTKQMASA